jgi:hypothetical protein
MEADYQKETPSPGQVTLTGSTGGAIDGVWIKQ